MAYLAEKQNNAFGFFFSYIVMHYQNKVWVYKISCTIITLRKSTCEPHRGSFPVLMMTQS